MRVVVVILATFVLEPQVLTALNTKPSSRKATSLALEGSLPSPSQPKQFESATMDEHISRGPTRPAQLANTTVVQDWVRSTGTATVQSTLIGFVLLLFFVTMMIRILAPEAKQDPKEGMAEPRAEPETEAPERGN
mmetsp:Transcript_31707/g.67431  ORF Transcript_31707/g.67431 Transcript_31707/m.67431 type:complete len:135 (+) Transcript_31707:158-562(+)